MSTWAKLDSDIRNNGKIAEAGPDGALLYLSLLCLHTAKGRAGVVPSSCCKPARMRVEAGAFLGSFDVARIEAAIDACVEAQLVERVTDEGTPCAQNGADGAHVRAAFALRLRGWCDEHAVACSHCRKPNPEPSHKTCPTCRESRNTDRKPSNDAGARRSRAHGAKRAHFGAEGAQKAALVSDSVSVSDIPPTPQRGERAVARGASAARAEPEPAAEPTRPKPSDASPIADLTNALMATTLRSGMNGIRRRAECREIAVRVAPTGIAPPDVRTLWAIASDRSNSDPGGLLNEWLFVNAPGYWRDVVAEHESKGRQAVGAAARSKSEQDLLDGIYGADPRPAASVVAAVLSNARPA